MKIHKTLTPEHWFSFSIFEQLANIGCDIERTIQWKQQGNSDYSQKAFDRALELLDLTIDDPKNNGGRLKEIVRTREALVDHFIYDNEYNTTDKQWQNYFFEFNYAAAVQRGK
ncbi:hypothetical protein CVU75_03170 [Candidatus Dependentiae bacterium HGW-Dependentiae-1]|nr:MAG: hypothetical protein CVU75_03170 [Candidatus Dependentiae bacterium HGW-Dependentiae-1]